MKDPRSTIHDLRSTVNRQPKQTAGNYSSPAAQDIGKTKIYGSNKGAGVD